MLQQTPSTQIPLLHSAAPAHAAPFGFLPHALCALQVRPGMHWVFPRHCVKHLFPTESQI
jgi:hypothetical protein